MQIRVISETFSRKTTNMIITLKFKHNEFQKCSFPKISFVITFIGFATKKLFINQFERYSPLL